ncbi:MAG TPA: signal peptidase II [Anaerolineales bacterium]|nr:signal peptidase II [Anaerolineales bacterium]
MTKFRRLSLVILVLLFCTGCDRVTKDLAQKMLASAPPVSLLHDAIRIEYRENPGAMLSLGANLPGQARFILFVLFVGLLLAVTLGYAIKGHGLNSSQLFGLALVTSGGIGNFLDRLLNNGAAIDFMNIGIGPVRTGIFNVADLLIVAGIAVFIVSSAGIRTRAASKTDA